VFKNLTFIILLTLCANISYAQSVLQVFSAGSQKPLMNAAIYYKCLDSKCPVSKNLIYTDSLGKCVINGIHGYNIEVMMIGYVRYKTTLTANQNKSIYLKENVNDLNEFVVTGQYEQTSAVKSVQKN